MKNIYLFFLLLILTNIKSFAQETTERGMYVKKNSNSYKKKYALLVGINSYKDDKIPPLKYAVNDAKELSSMLINTLNYDPNDVVVLLDSVATRENILDNLSKFINDDNVPENSELLVYFAGHGTVSKSGNKGFLLNYDAKEGSELSSAISMDEIGRIANECRSKHVLFLIDACYGGFANSRSGSSALVKNLWNQKARHVITAGNSEEKVIEAAEWQHSVFTKVLLDAIAKKEADVNNDNILSSSELHLYLEQRIAFLAKQKGGKQTPQLGKLSPDDGTFFIELIPNAISRLDDNTQMIDDDEIVERLKSTIEVVANVPTARVFINSIEMGYLSDSKFTAKLNPGFYKIELKLDKYEVATKELLIKPDTTVKVNMLMESKYTIAKFNVTPDDAAVILNNNLIGTGSFTAELPKGRHEVTIDKRGYKPEKSIINLVQDRTELTFKIQKINGIVEIFSVPKDATLIINADTVGFTPKTVTLPFGVHNVILIKEDYIPESFEIDIKESSMIRKDVLLKIKPEVMVQREVSKLRAKSIRGFLVNSVLAGGAYLGYQHGDQQLKAMKNNTTKTGNDSDETAFQSLKYGGLGLTAIFGIGAVSNLVKLFTHNKTQIMRKYLENDKVSINISPAIKGFRASVTIGI